MVRQYIPNDFYRYISQHTPGRGAIIDDFVNSYLTNDVKNLSGSF